MSVLSTAISPAYFAVLPLRDIVVFPGMIAPLFVGREKSISALEEVVRLDKKILLVTQKDPTQDSPTINDIHDIGVVSGILQLLKLPDGTVKVLVEGQARAKMVRVFDQDRFFRSEIELLHETYEETKENEALRRSALNQFERYVKSNKKLAHEIVASVSQVQEPGRLSDTIAAHISLKIPERQQLLEELDIAKRLEMLFGFMESEIEVLSAEHKIRSRVKKQMEKSQREYYLNEQLKAIHKELGEEEGKDEIALLEQRIKATKLSKEASERALSEVKKLRVMAPMSAEATVVRNYLDWLLSLPWSKRSKVRKDLKAAQLVLDNDHYGLEKVKERIVEYLAVQQRTQKMRGPILCLVGPPGVGKTSLAKSIAEATGRKFVKMALGGVRDEAEIRGHRKTYIGSMPGKILHSMRKAETVNPLFLLDEIDKMGVDFRGDPASALLEVLDPEQNSKFSDHYLEVDYDLSDVMFVATSNSLNLPPALLDRLEIIRLSGYTEEEKIEICRRHLIPKQVKMHGLKPEEFSVSEDAVRDLIRYYTREAGVRNLERELANLARKATKEIVMGEKLQKVEVTSENLEKYARVRRYSFGQTEMNDLPGVVTGLAYTEVGGELLTIEAVLLPGKGVVRSTGKLGDVMQESAQAAYSYARSKSLEFGIIPPFYQKKDIHIHVPEGATPKDGPSAGIAMFTAIVSILTGIPVRSDVAMTGEITLRGRVFAIGGLKEKLLAALRGGVKTVIIPKENAKDLSELPANLLEKLTILPVSTADEVLAIALSSVPKSVKWVEEESLLLSSPSLSDDLDVSELRPN